MPSAVTGFCCDGGPFEPPVEPEFRTWNLLGGASGDPFVAKTIISCLQADCHGRCMGLRSRSKGDGLPGYENDFETARLSVFATSGSPRLWTNVFCNCRIRVETRFGSLQGSDAPGMESNGVYPSFIDENSPCVSSRPCETLLIASRQWATPIRYFSTRASSPVATGASFRIPRGKFHIRKCQICNLSLAGQPK